MTPAFNAFMRYNSVLYKTLYSALTSWMFDDFINTNYKVYK